MTDTGERDKDPGDADSRYWGLEEVSAELRRLLTSERRKNRSAGQAGACHRIPRAGPPHHVEPNHPSQRSGFIEILWQFRNNTEESRIDLQPTLMQALYAEMAAMQYP